MKKVVIPPTNNLTRHQYSSCATPDNTNTCLKKYVTEDISTVLLLKTDTSENCFHL